MLRFGTALSVAVCFLSSTLCASTYYSNRFTEVDLRAAPRIDFRGYDMAALDGFSPEATVGYLFIIAQESEGKEGDEFRKALEAYERNGFELKRKQFQGVFTDGRFVWRVVYYFEARHVNVIHAYHSITVDFLPPLSFFGKPILTEVRKHSSFFYIDKRDPVGGISSAG